MGNAKHNPRSPKFVGPLAERQIPSDGPKIRNTTDAGFGKVRFIPVSYERKSDNGALTRSAHTQAGDPLKFSDRTYTLRADGSLKRLSERVEDDKT